MSSNELVSAPPSDHFTQVVNAYEDTFPDDLYKDAIDRMRQTNLKSLNQKDVQLILRPFLFTWGRMGRVLGEEGCPRICSLLKEMNEELFDLRYYMLESDFEKVTNIPELYNKIMCVQFKSGSKHTGSTATSKVLHLVAPDFFAMWDDPIRGFYNFKVDGEEYKRFLANMKQWIIDLNPIITPLSQRFGKTKTKIIDEFNWYRLRPWWHKSEWSIV